MSPRAWDIARLGACVALVGGLVEVAGLELGAVLFGIITNRSPYAVWMSPAGYVLLMAVLAVPLAVAGRIHPRLRQPDAARFASSSCAAFSVLLALFHERLYTGALVLLALGVGAQAARWAGRRPERLTRAVRRGLPVLAAVVLALGIGTHAWTAWTERRALRRLPAAATESPNILLIIFDTVRWMNVSLAGYHRPTTPKLEELAARGVSFTRAFSTSPWTLPSHGSMFTGRMPDDLSADWYVPLDDRYPTVAELVTRAGYAAAGFVANHDYATAEHGLARGFATYRDRPVSLATVVLSTGLGRWVATSPSWRPLIGTDDVLGLKRADAVVDEFLSWVGRDRERPFFAFLNFYDAHDPYLPPDPWFRMFGVERRNRLSYLRRVPASQPPPAGKVEDEMAAYDGAIAYMDHQLGRLLDSLLARGMLDETLVIVTSDHGEELGEHGLLFHGHSLYATQLWVPLVIAGPGVPEGVRVETPVSLLDLAATMLEAANVTPPETVRGASLSRLWSGDQPVGQYPPIRSWLRRLPPQGAALPAGRGDMESTVLWPLHFIRGPGGVSMFDLSTDPYELVDVRGRWYTGPEGADPR